MRSTDEDASRRQCRPSEEGNVHRREDAKGAAEVKLADGYVPALVTLQPEQGSNQETAQKKEDGHSKPARNELFKACMRDIDQ